MTRNALDPVDTARTRVFSFDTIPPAPELLKAGKVHTLVGQKYFGWGSEAIRLLSEIKAGRMPPQKIIDSGVDVVVGLRKDLPSVGKAERSGLRVLGVAEAAADADITMMTLPDESMAGIYR